MHATARIYAGAVTLPAALLLLAASAHAKVLVPPGNSGASQYVEVVPSAEGGVTPGAQSHNHGHVLTPSTERSLKSLGPEGKAVASFAQATGTPRSSRSQATTPQGSNATTKHGGKAGRSGNHQASTTTPPTSSAVVSGPIVRTAAVSSGSLGWGLPLALGLAALAAVAILVSRRRGPGSRNSDSD